MTALPSFASVLLRSVGAGRSVDILGSLRLGDWTGADDWAGGFDSIVGRGGLTTADGIVGA